MYTRFRWVVRNWMMIPSRRKQEAVSLYESRRKVRTARTWSDMQLRRERDVYVTFMIP
jgi:hypothetical protein